MFNLMDVILLAVVLISAFVGYKAGFVKTAIGLLSFFVALGLALLFYKPLAIILTEKTTIDDWIVDKIVNFEYKPEDEQKIIEAETEEEKRENTIEGVLSQFPVSLSEKIEIEEKKRDVKQELASKVSEHFMNLMSLIVIYVVVRVTLLVAEIVLNGMMQIPILKQINEILGLSFGAIIGFVEMYIAFAIIALVSSITDISFIVTAIRSSMIASIMFDYNLILKILF